MGLSATRYVFFVGGVICLGCGFQARSESPTGKAGSGGSMLSGGAGDGGDGGDGGGAGGGGAGDGGAGGDSGGFDAGGAGGAFTPRDGASGVSTPDANCGALSQGATKLPPDILIVLDASLSMNATADNGCTQNCGADSKWSQMAEALGQVVGETDTMVNWGLKFFADDAMCTVGAGVNVDVGTGSGAAITDAIAGRTDAMGNVRTGSRTPTRAAEMAAAAYLGTLTDPNPKFILLATDGLPNCAPGMTNTMTSDAVGTVTAVGDAFGAGVATFVVGVAPSADPSSDMTLSEAATAGGHPRAVSPPYYPWRARPISWSAFGDIIGIAATCTFQIGPAPNDYSSVDHIDVFGDGAKIEARHHPHERMGLHRRHALGDRDLRDDLRRHQDRHGRGRHRDVPVPGELTVGGRWAWSLPSANVLSTRDETRGALVAGAGVHGGRGRGDREGPRDGRRLRAERGPIRVRRNGDRGRAARGPRERG